MNQQIIGAGIDSLNMGENSVDEVLVLQLKAWANERLLHFGPARQEYKIKLSKDAVIFIVGLIFI